MKKILPRILIVLAALICLHPWTAIFGWAIYVVAAVVLLLIDPGQRRTKIGWILFPILSVFVVWLVVVAVVIILEL